MTGVQQARKWVKLGPREVAVAANKAERQFRRKCKIALHTGAWERVPNKPHSIDYEIC